MFYLQLFKIDDYGDPTDLVQISAPYRSVKDAMAAARQLRLGTHVRITDDSGEPILDNCLLASALH